MQIKRLSLLILGFALLIGLAGCGSPDADVSETMSPEQVVQAFYDWYVAYPGNPLVDGDYRSNEFLTASFVQKVDELIASFDRGGYDPFLCAQDIPQSFTVAPAVLSSGGNTASVVVDTSFSGHTFTVNLQKVDGGWRIADVICNVPGPASPLPEGPMPTTPEGAVSGFYSWYLWYAREVGNPLVDGAYRSSEYLTASFVQKVDEIIASFDRSGYDPFLCAQDIPQSFTLDPAVLSSDGNAASLVVHTSFEGHSFTVQLEAQDGRWAISDVICPAAGGGSAPAAATTPEDVVRSFYDWYLATINAGRATGEIRSPLVDGTYASTGYLTDELVQKIEATLASFDGAGYDPILCAQDIPESFTIPAASISSEKTTVEVQTSFPGHSYQVEVVQVGGDWKINDIRCSLGDEGRASSAVAGPIPEPESTDVDPTAGWQLFRDDRYGFQLQYPPDWTFVEVELRDPELDKPLVRLLHFLPQAWVEGLNQGGPPDPNQPPVIAPLAVEVSVGGMQAYRRLYVEPTQAETVQLGDNTALLEEYASGDIREIRYLFQDPDDDDLRITLRDQISGFPDRARDNQEVIEATNLILTTFHFTP